MFGQTKNRLKQAVGFFVYLDLAINTYTNLSRLSGEQETKQVE